MFQMGRERCFRWEGRDVSDGKGEVFQMVRTYFQVGRMGGGGGGALRHLKR